MTQKLIVCFDGTWGTPENQALGLPAPTNVHKIYRAISEDNGKQKKYYHTGIGAEGDLSAGVLGGAIGKNLGEHIQSAYYWLAEHYQVDGDSASEIYLLSSSRGAFTVTHWQNAQSNSHSNIQEKFKKHLETSYPENKD